MLTKTKGHFCTRYWEAPQRTKEVIQTETVHMHLMNDVNNNDSCCHSWWDNPLISKNDNSSDRVVDRDLDTDVEVKTASPDQSDCCRIDSLEHHSCWPV